MHSNQYIEPATEVMGVEEEESLRLKSRNEGLDDDGKSTSPMEFGTPSPAIRRASTYKEADAKSNNCLCSPTTHAGSFRCRYHRNNSNSFRRWNSVGKGSTSSGKQSMHSALTDLITEKKSSPCG